MTDLQWGETPQGLKYPTGHTSRVWVSRPDIEPVQQAAHKRESSIKHDYWSPEIRQTHTLTRNARELKTPKVYPNPNVSDPHTAAFTDFHEYSFGGQKGVYVNYAATRRDQQGLGHASAMIRGIAEAHPSHELDFGQVHDERIAHLALNLQEEGRKIRMKNYYSR